MKTKTLYVVTALLLFSSCANLTVKKRHYRPGYYISMSGKKHSQTPDQGKPEKQNQATLMSSNTLPTEEKHDQLTTDDLSQANTSDVFVPSHVEGVAPSTVSSKNSRSQSASSVNKIKENIKTHSTRFSENLKSSVKPETNQSNRERDGYSLFWLVVLIVLILWAIAWLTGGWGLGGLIHLLLLVALILFILWLLRII